jgi:ribosomal protein L11 methyltransferase
VIVNAVSWTRLEVAVSPEAADAVANFLIELGSPGLQLQEETDATTVQAYLPDPAGTKIDLVHRYLDDLREMGLNVGPQEIRWDHLESADWLAAWRERYGPIRVGRRLLVRPSWIEVPRQDEVITIIIDPQMAFGTGEHVTTQFCLRSLEDLVQKGDMVLDVGTGSGILSIAAAKLGAGQVLGLDNDPQAVATARKNARLNGVSRQIKFSGLAVQRIPRMNYRLVVANIDGHTLLPLLPRLRRAARRGGYLILAGFTAQEETSLRRGLAPSGFQIECLEHQGEWVSALVRIPASET